MAELKTKVNEGSVNKFLDSIEDEAKRRDSHLLFKMMEKATKNEARMWGDSIVGFGAAQPRGRRCHPSPRLSLDIWHRS